MTCNNPNRNNRTKRRTVLKASGLSLTTGLAPAAASADTDGQKQPPSNRQQESEPDIRVIDNSATEAPVIITYNRKNENSAADNVEESNLGSIEIDTKGVNSPDIQDKLDSATLEATSAEDIQNLIERKTRDSRETIEQISVNVREQIRVSVKHQKSTDSVLVNVDSDGASPEETVLVKVGPDGTVSESLDIACRDM